MSQVAKWFDRKFAFTFPVELYPNVCARLRGSPARLEGLLQSCARERLVRKPEGKWSAQEHAGHLLDLESLWMARLDDYMADRSQLTLADLSNKKTDTANHNAGEISDILAGFRADRMRLLDRVQELQATMFVRSIPHPRLKQPMRLVDHLYFVAEHDDHHLASIWELIR
jgi:uncharacterized damage-inducible protein DinB